MSIEVYFILIGPLSYFEFLDAMDNSGSVCAPWSKSYAFWISSLEKNPCEFFKIKRNCQRSKNLICAIYYKAQITQPSKDRFSDTYDWLSAGLSHCWSVVVADGKIRREHDLQNETKSAERRVLPPLISYFIYCAVRHMI